MSRRKLPGFAFLILSGIAFVIMSALVKTAAGEAPLSQVLFCRNAIAALVYAGLFASCRKDVLRLLLSRKAVARSVFGHLSFGIYALCLAAMALSDVVALFYTAPVWTVLIAWVVSNRHPPAVVQIALALGLIGMTLMVRPTMNTSPALIILALSGAFLAGLATFSIRVLVEDETPERAAFAFMSWGTILLLPLALRDWSSVSITSGFGLFAIGLLAAAAQLTLTLAYRRITAMRGAVFDFLRLPLSVLFGIIVFGEQHGLTTWIGVGLILSGSVLSLSSHLQPSRNRHQSD